MRQRFHGPEGFGACFVLRRLGLGLPPRGLRRLIVGTLPLNRFGCRTIIGFRRIICRDDRSRDHARQRRLPLSFGNDWVALPGPAAKTVFTP